MQNSHFEHNLLLNFEILINYETEFKHLVYRLYS